MPRQLRIEYPGAIYPVMNRGDRREPIFQDDADWRCFMRVFCFCRRRWFVIFCRRRGIDRRAVRTGLPSTTTNEFGIERSDDST